MGDEKTPFTRLCTYVIKKGKLENLTSIAKKKKEKIQELIAFENGFYYIASKDNKSNQNICKKIFSSYS